MKISGKAYFFTSIAFLCSVLNNGNSTKLGHHRRSHKHKTHERLGKHENDGERIAEKNFVHYQTNLDEDQPRFKVIQYEKHLFPEQNIHNLEENIHHHKEQQIKRHMKALKRFGRKKRRRLRMLKREERRHQRAWKRNHTEEILDKIKHGVLFGISNHDNGIPVSKAEETLIKEIPDNVESEGHDYIQIVHKKRPIKSTSIEKVQIARRFADASLNNLKRTSSNYKIQPRSMEELLEDEHWKHLDEAERRLDENEEM